MVLSRFDSLSVRPPTPPKDLHDHDHDHQLAADETLLFLDDPFGERPPIPKIIATSRTLLNTPEHSPSSDISIPSSATRQKRVNFEIQTCASPRKKVAAPSRTPTRSSPLRPLPQTRVSKPLKSILKLSDATPTPPPAAEGAAAHTFKSFADMLESIVKLLASSERPSRMDAYHSLQRTMQAYDKMPEDRALKQKMSLLTQFMRRDLQAPSPTGSGLDSQLVAQALKLFMALLRIPNVASAMDEDFCAFFVDRTIQLASDASMPKLIVNHHLAALMQQSLRPKIITAARVEKLLDVLDTIPDRIGGNSVHVYRVRIYRKLIQQRPDIMTKHTERWFKVTITALVSNQKELCQSARDTALTAAKTIGHDKHVARFCLAVLNRPRSEGGTIANTIVKQLQKMLKSDNAAIVPQIWAAVTVLLRDFLQVDLFSSMREWLQIFEICIASNNDAVRVQTNVAYTHLIYSVSISNITTLEWTGMFTRILLYQFQRRLPPKRAERDAVSSAYATLLYYALRPTASYEQLDRYWREFVADFWTPLVSLPSSPHTIAACRIVSALLNGSRKPWNEQRVLEQTPQTMIKAGDLPLLDPRWVRKSITVILQFVETLLDATPWTENEQQDGQPVKIMWLALLDSLVEASSKEVMASSETKDAMARIVNLLRRVWDKHTAKLAVPQQKEDLWASKFCFLIETVVQKLGAFQFSEKCLTRNGTDDFEVASTPSHRSRQQGARISPLVYFVDLLVNQSEGTLPDHVRLRALKLTLEPCFKAQSTRLDRLELLRDCSASANSSSNAVVAVNFWANLTTLLQSSLEEQTSDPNEPASRPLGREYDLVVQILGLGHSYFLDRPRGHESLTMFINLVRKEAGEAAVVLAIVEKVSEVILKRVPDEDKTSCLSYISILLRNLPKQTNRRSLEQARQSLWPSSQPTGRHNDFDPYSDLYVAIVSAGSASYRDLESENVETTSEFLGALATSIKGCSTSHLAVYLRKTQEVIQLWVEDAHRKMQSNGMSLRALHRQVIALWTEVCNAIERLPRKDGQILIHLEPLITAGFVSRRRGVVNISIAIWNKTFGKEESLRYPSRLEKALRRLRATVELSLPSLEDRTGDIINELSFYESDNSVDDAQRAYTNPRIKESPFKVAKTARRSMIRSPAVSTPGSKKASVRQASKIRLRHDNSQIQFETIVSSPSNPFNQESQVLTERQREMIERQRFSGGLFAEMGAGSPLQEAPRSPMEIHSDALTADELLDHASHVTPLKTLAAMGPMDAFLGSSPTPHARKNTRQIASDDTILATPTTARASKLANIEELGSSPPQFGREVDVDARQPGSDVRVCSSFEYRQPETTMESFFDEQTTINEEALLDVTLPISDLGEPPEMNHLLDAIMIEMPSSTIDLQLTAQLDADIQAHVAATAEEPSVIAQESNADYVDAASHQQPAILNLEQAGCDTEVVESQFPSPVVATTPRKADFDTSSTSRVGDSFSRPSSSKGTPRSQGLRRSSRQSTASSPAQSPNKNKRTLTLSKAERTAIEHSKQEPAGIQMPVQQAEDRDMLDNIVVEVPATRPNQAMKRKSMNDVQSPTEPQMLIPETDRKRGPVRRSQSLLSHVESSQDVLVKDTPAPKRAKQTASQDVSTAKSTTLPPQRSQTKRLSHVQITPKRSSERGSSVRASSVMTEAAPPDSAKAKPSPVATREAEANQSNAQPVSVGVSTPSRTFTERVILTPRSIINQLRSLKDYLFSAPQLTLGRDEEREIDDALFDIRTQLHAAGRRGEGTKEEN